MKKNPLFFAKMPLFIFATLLLFSKNKGFSQDEFITKWNLATPGSGANQINFTVGATGTVNYSWEGMPSGTSGSGSLTNVNSSYPGVSCTIAGFITNDIIILKISPTNLDFVSFWSADNDRLIEVNQWGSVNWKYMISTFEGCENLQITAIDIPNLVNVQYMNYMFRYCRKLNSPININSWNTSNVVSMEGVFLGAYAFNQNIGSWDTSKVQFMDYMFWDSFAFNQNISNWNILKVVSMTQMFENAYNFNQPIGTWNTINVRDMERMFANAKNFNQDIGTWNTSKVQNMAGMFIYTEQFNQNIGNWNTSSVVIMDELFSHTFSFNQPIGSWNTNSVMYMTHMFFNAMAFNNDIGGWDISNVLYMDGMFNHSLNNNYGYGVFNQNLGLWKLNGNVSLTQMFNNSGMDCNNYSNTLDGWSTNTLLPYGRSLGAVGVKYSSNVIFARNNIINTKGWSIIGDILSTTSESLKSGNWDDPTVWSCNQIPSNVFDAKINLNHVVTIPNNVIGSVKNLINNGSLLFEGNANLILNSN